MILVNERILIIPKYNNHNKIWSLYYNCFPLINTIWLLNNLRLPSNDSTTIDKKSL